MTAGKAAHSVQDKIKSYTTAAYTLTGKAGLTLGVKLKTNQASNDFNIRQSSQEEALFIGSNSGNNFQAKLPADGEYPVQVYLMCNAVRRSATASYSLEMGLRD